jgi:hypothetical protein
MNEVTWHTMAHLRLDRAHLHPSLRQGGRRVLAAPAFGKAANQRTSSDPLGFARPFIPSSLRRPNTRLRTEPIGAWTSRATCQAPRTTQAFPDLSDQAPGSDVLQDSDFPWEMTVRIFAVQKILPSPLRRAAKQSVFFSPQNSYLVSPTNKMSRRNTPGIVPFALDISTEAKSRFMALHEAFGFKSKTATFEAVLFAMSLKDKIDPQILQRIDAKLDRVIETLEETL